MLAIGNDELDEAPPIGNFILCHACGKRHRVHYSNEILNDGSKVPSKLLGYYKCQGKSWLTAINGKDIRKTK